MIRHRNSRSFTGLHGTADGFIEVFPTAITQQGHQFAGIPEFYVSVFDIVDDQIVLLADLFDFLLSIVSFLPQNKFQISSPRIPNTWQMLSMLSNET